MLAIEFEIMRISSDAPSTTSIVLPKYRSLPAVPTTKANRSLKAVMSGRRAEMISLVADREVRVQVRHTVVLIVAAFFSVAAQFP